MPKIDIPSLPVKTGSGYPGEFANAVDGRAQVSLGDPSGLTQFGSNLVILAPGALSSLRHWHEQQDEFLVVTQGVCTLLDDHGETELHPGDCAAFPAGDPNGHTIKNASDAPAQFVVIGTRTPSEVAHYSDVDLAVRSEDGVYRFTRKDGSSFE